MCRDRWWNRSSLLRCDRKRIAATWTNGMPGKVEMYHSQDSVVDWVLVGVVEWALAGWRESVGVVDSVLVGLLRRHKKKGPTSAALLLKDVWQEVVRERRRLEKVPKRRKPK